MPFYECAWRNFHRNSFSIFLIFPVCKRLILLEAKNSPRLLILLSACDLPALLHKYKALSLQSDWYWL